MLRSKQFPKEDCGVIKLNSIEYHWIKSYFHLQHRASLAQETIASQPFIWNETMEEGRSANRNELLSRDGMNFAQQMALGVCHLGRLKTCWIKWESGSLYVVWRTVAIALELLQYSTHREAEKQFPKEAVRRATVIRSEDGRRHCRAAVYQSSARTSLRGKGWKRGPFPPLLFKDDMQKKLSISEVKHSSYKSAP